MKTKQGFTLIELLIVVAIIGILAAIAIPNFLQAQIRAKVARAQSEHATLATALEVYATDHGGYVFDYDSRGWPWYITDAITSPINYLSGQGAGLVDPFRMDVYSYGPTGERYRYVNYGACKPAPDNWYACQYPGPWITQKTPAMTEPSRQLAMSRYGMWRLSCAGPDRTASYNTVTGNYLEQIYVYDPTNGTVSSGDIVRSQKYSKVESDYQ